MCQTTAAASAATAMATNSQWAWALAVWPGCANAGVAASDAVRLKASAESFMSGLPENGSVEKTRARESACTICRQLLDISSGLGPRFGSAAPE